MLWFPRFRAADRLGIRRYRYSGGGSL